MRRWLPLLFAVLVFHSGKDGKPVYIVDSQVVAVRSSEGFGGDGPTLIILMNGSAFVRETPEAVAEKLGWKP